VVHHARLRVVDASIEMGDAHGPYQPMPTMFFHYVNDADVQYARVMEAGATSLGAPSHQLYGDRVGAVQDAFGNQWWIATHIANR
jgi:PhnB protein